MANRFLAALTTAALVSGWGPGVAPLNLPCQLERFNGAISDLEWQFANASAECAWAGASHDAGWPYSSFLRTGVLVAHIDSTGFGTPASMLSLRGRVNVTDSWVALVDMLAVPITNIDAYNEGFVIVLHNDARGVDAVCGTSNCLAYTDSSAGPQTGVYNCGCGTCQPISPSVALAVDVYSGCMRVGVGGLFAAADACTSPNFYLPGSVVLTAKFQYAPVPGGTGGAGGGVLSGALFLADGSPVDGSQVSFNVSLPLATVLHAPDGTARFAVGAATGFFRTDWTLQGVGWYSRIAPNITLASTSPTVTPSAGILPSSPAGNIAVPLFGSVGVVFVVVIAAAAYWRWKAPCLGGARGRARMVDSSSSSGGGSSSAAHLPPHKKRGPFASPDDIADTTVGGAGSGSAGGLSLPLVGAMVTADTGRAPP